MVGSCAATREVERGSPEGRSCEGDDFAADESDERLEPAVLGLERPEALCSLLCSLPERLVHPERVDQHELRGEVLLDRRRRSRDDALGPGRRRLEAHHQSGSRLGAREVGRPHPQRLQTLREVVGRRGLRNEPQRALPLLGSGPSSYGVEDVLHPRLLDALGKDERPRESVRQDDEDALETSMRRVGCPGGNPERSDWGKRAACLIASGSSNGMTIPDELPARQEPRAD